MDVIVRIVRLAHDLAVLADRLCPAAAPTERPEVEEGPVLIEEGTSSPADHVGANDLPGVINSLDADGRVDSDLLNAVTGLRVSGLMGRRTTEKRDCQSDGG